MSEYDPANAEIRPDTVYPYGTHNLPTREVSKGMFAGRVGVCPYCPTAGGAVPVGQALYWLPWRHAYFATPSCGDPKCVERVPSRHLAEGPASQHIPADAERENSMNLARAMTQEQAVRVLDQADAGKRKFTPDVEAVLVALVAGVPVHAAKPVPPHPQPSPFVAVQCPDLPMGGVA
jgi:hypothetical protein